MADPAKCAGRKYFQSIGQDIEVIVGEYHQMNDDDNYWDTPKWFLDAYDKLTKHIYTGAELLKYF